MIRVRIPKGFFPESRENSPQKHEKIISILLRVFFFQNPDLIPFKIFRGFFPASTALLPCFCFASALLLHCFCLACILLLFCFYTASCYWLSFAYLPYYICSACCASVVCFYPAFLLLLQYFYDSVFLLLSCSVHHPPSFCFDFILIFLYPHLFCF